MLSGGRTGDNWSDGQHWLGADPLDRAREVAAALQRAATARRSRRRGTTRPGDPRARRRAARARSDTTGLRHGTGTPRTRGILRGGGGRASRLRGARQRRAQRARTVGTSGVVLGPGRESRVTGSLLGLDVALAPFSLVRLSSRLPPRRPSLNENDRRALIESVALVRELGDADRDRIVDAIRKGRDRLAAVATPEQAITMADEIGMTGARRSLLIWSATRTPDRMAAFLSPSELLWLGTRAHTPRRAAPRVGRAGEGAARMSVSAAPRSAATGAVHGPMGLGHLRQRVSGSQSAARRTARRAAHAGGAARPRSHVRDAGVREQHGEPRCQTIGARSSNSCRR